MFNLFRTNILIFLSVFLVGSGVIMFFTPNIRIMQFQTYVTGEIKDIDLYGGKTVEGAPYIRGMMNFAVFPAPNPNYDPPNKIVVRSPAGEWRLEQYGASGSNAIIIWTGGLKAGTYNVTVELYGYDKLLDKENIIITILSVDEAQSKAKLYIPEWQGYATPTYLQVKVINTGDFQDWLYIEINKNNVVERGEAIWIPPKIYRALEIKTSFNLEAGDTFTVKSSLTNQTVLTATINPNWYYQSQQEETVEETIEEQKQHPIIQLLGITMIFSGVITSLITIYCTRFGVCHV